MYSASSLTPPRMASTSWHLVMRLGCDGDATSDDFNFEVQHSTDELSTELDTCSTILMSQDKLLRCVVKEKNELEAKLEQVLKDLEFVRAPILSDNSCTVHMSNLATLQNKYAHLIGELD